MRGSNKDDEDKKSNWPALSALFSSVIEPVRDWAEADCIGELSDMAMHFHNAFPDQAFTSEDLQLALHDMGVPFERNEHNNKFYYLAKWR